MSEKQLTKQKLIDGLASIENLKDRIKQLEEFDGSISDSLQETEDKLNLFESKVKKYNAILSEISVEIDRNSKQISQLQVSVSGMQKSIEAVHERIGAAKERIDTIKERVDFINEDKKYKISLAFNFIMSIIAAVSMYFAWEGSKSQHQNSAAYEERIDHADK